MEQTGIEQTHPACGDTESADLSARKQSRSELKPVWHLLALNILSAAVFIILAVMVAADAWLTRIDSTAGRFIAAGRSAFLTDTMIGVTTVARPGVLLFAAGVIAGVLLYCRRRRQAAATVLPVLAAIIAQAWLKLFFARPRPVDALLDVAGYGFPSAHAAAAAAFFPAVVWLFAGGVTDWVGRGLFVTCNIGLMVLVGFSRVYLGVHRTSDVIAGFALGLFMMTLAAMAATLADGG